MNGSTYDSSGSFNQQRSNAAGCDSTITLNLTINKSPDARFSSNINNSKVTFTPVEMNAKTYSWDFGNGATSVQKSPVYTYPSIGSYVVKLKIISNEDCENEDDSTISIQSTGNIIKNVKTGIILFPNPANNEV